MTQWLKESNNKVVTTPNVIKLTEKDILANLERLLKEHNKLLEQTKEFYNKHHAQEVYSIITSLEENIRIIKSLKRIDY